MTDERPIPPDRASFHVRSRGSLVIVAVEGELDVSTAGALEAGLGELRWEGCPVLVDLSRVSFIDATGLQGLRRAVRRLRDDGAVVRVSRPSRRAERCVRLIDAAAAVAGL
jgi:anti-sigma B factor antagonist